MALAAQALSKMPGPRSPHERVDKLVEHEVDALKAAPVLPMLAE